VPTTAETDDRLGGHVTTPVAIGSSFRQAEDSAPELKLTLVDGESLPGVLDELETYELFATHFDEIHVGETDGNADAEANGSNTPGIIDRVVATAKHRDNTAKLI
jgi:hypothetical protein